MIEEKGKDNFSLNIIHKRNDNRINNYNKLIMSI